MLITGEGDGTPFGNEQAPEPTTAAEGAATGQEQAQPAENPDARFLEAIKAFREGGATPEQITQALQNGYWIQSEQGKQQLRQKAEEMLLNDPSHWAKVVPHALAADKKLRRASREFLGALKPEGEQVQPEYGEGTEVNQQVQSNEMAEFMAEMRQELQSVKALAQGAAQGNQRVITGVSRASELQSFAAQNEIASRSMHKLAPAVDRMMDNNPQAFAGPGGVARAAKAVMQEWRDNAIALGLQVPNSGPKIPNSTGGGVTDAGVEVFDRKATRGLIAEGVRTGDFSGIEALFKKRMQAQTE